VTKWQSEKVAKYIHEEVASVPRGWKVRTVTRGSHRVRIAFPPGPRQTGSGRLISVLHPRGESQNPCRIRYLMNPAELLIMGANPHRPRRPNPTRIGAQISAMKDRGASSREVGRFLSRATNPGRRGSYSVIDPILRRAVRTAIKKGTAFRDFWSYHMTPEQRGFWINVDSFERGAQELYRHSIGGGIPRNPRSRGRRENQGQGAQWHEYRNFQIQELRGKFRIYDQHTRQVTRRTFASLVDAKAYADTLDYYGRPKRRANQSVAETDRNYARAQFTRFLKSGYLQGHRLQDACDHAALSDLSRGAARKRLVAAGAPAAEVDSCLSHAYARQGRNPRASAARNPDSTEEAAELYEQFHGREPAEILELQEPEARGVTLTSLGDLIELQIVPLEGRQWVQLDFSGDRIKLASNAKGSQLYFIGGNQTLTGEVLRTFGTDTSKELVELGQAATVVYRAKKSVTDFKTSNWEHSFGEESGLRPILAYDTRTRRMLLVGGEYTIEAPGIIN
jgi:hypothetical protein